MASPILHQTLKYPSHIKFSQNNIPIPQQTNLIIELVDTPTSTHQQNNIPKPRNMFYVFLTINGTWQTMDLDLIIISILHATIKENNLQSSTCVPTQSCIMHIEKEKRHKPWVSNVSHQQKKHQYSYVYAFTCKFVQFPITSFLCHLSCSIHLISIAIFLTPTSSPNFQPHTTNHSF